MAVSATILSRHQNFAAAQQKGEFVSGGSHKYWEKKKKRKFCSVLLFIENKMHSSE